MQVNIALLTVTDTRTIDTDKSGAILVKKIKEQNHKLVDRKIVKDEKEEIKKGTRMNQIMRHTLGLFHGQTGSNFWKRYLSENMCVRDADVQKIDHIMDKIKFNNLNRSVG